MYCLLPIGNDGMPYGAPIGLSGNTDEQALESARDTIQRAGQYGNPLGKDFREQIASFRLMKQIGDYIVP